MAESKPKAKKEVKEETKEPVEGPKEDLQKVVSRQAAQIEELTQLVRSTADKGRLFNYDQAKAQGNKAPTKIKMSKYGGGLITGWSIKKDKLVFHPTTGEPVGEEQEIEIVIRENGGDMKKHTFQSYKAFSDARYSDRIEYRS